MLLKREDLNHTGSHKINNVLGQALLTRRMGKTRVIAETGAGQHGVATATAAALLGMECRVYMGRVDTDRQALNVARMQLLGAEVIAVESGSQTLKDAMNEAMRDWVASVDNTHYLIGTVAGPHPFPKMVKEFQRVISTEIREQMLGRFGRLPDGVAACVGGGSNAMGTFADFIDTPEVALYGFEAGGDGVETGRHAAAIQGGSVGVLHGMRTYILQDADGQTMESHSISAGLDYPGVGPEHSWLAATGRAHYEAVTDADAMVGVRDPDQDRGHHARDRVGARPRRRDAARPALGRRAPGGRAGDRGLPVRARRQGRGHGHRVLRTHGQAGFRHRRDRMSVQDIAQPHKGTVPFRGELRGRAFTAAQGRGPRSPGRLPAGRLPERARLAGGAEGPVRRRRRRARRRPGRGRACRTPTR